MSKKIDEFKKIIRKACFLSKEEVEIFNQIPNEYWLSIFEHNFNSDINLVREILFYEFDENEYSKIENEKLKIKNLDKSSLMLEDFIKNSKPILFITDTDNDGSISQAILIEYVKNMTEKYKANIHIEYSQMLNSETRGFNLDLVDLWGKENNLSEKDEILIVTADNGINSRVEQERIQKKYPNAKILITDHHLPDEDLVIIENKNTVIFNPQYEPTPYFKEKNISGANTLGVLMNYMVDKFDYMLVDPQNKKELVNNIKYISRVGNLLDFVDTDITDKPLKWFEIEKFNSLRPLLNINNSLSQIIVGETSEKFFQKNFANVEGLNIEKVMELITFIKHQNILAKNLLSIRKNYDIEKQKNEVDAKRSERMFDEYFIEGVTKIQNDIDLINPNYIEQLRPWIFNYSCVLVDPFESKLNENMIKIYEDLRKAEGELLKEFRQADLLNIANLENSTIVHPKNNEITKVFNRKLLGKMYNLTNNGFLLILGSNKGTKVSGSMRTLFPIQEILKGKAPLEKMLNVKLSFQGHSKAAGFFIESTNGTPITTQTLNMVNQFLNNRVENIKNEEKLEEKTYLIANLNNISVIDSINRVVRGNLSNMRSITPILKFTNSTYITDNENLMQYSLQQLVKERKFGYVAIKTNFNGDAIVVPTELLRQIVNNNFKDYLEVDYIQDGVFMASRIIKHEKIKQQVKMSNNDNKKELTDYYKNIFLNNNNEIEISLEDLKNVPFFKNNNYKELEFNRFQNYVIDILENTKSDEICILDTEATGLGKAPKCFNLGALSFSINEVSGFEMSKEDFEKSYFKTERGEEYLLKDNERSKLIEISSSDVEALDFNDYRYLLEGVDGNKYLANKEKSSARNNFKKLHNFQIIDDHVKINREIKARAQAYLIKEDDFKLTQDIIDLTGIDNTMLNAVGMKIKDVDQSFVDKYKDKKVIFQAHNLPYDLGVVDANFPLIYEKMSNSLLSDSAIFTKEKLLSYDAIPIAHLPEFKEVLFYNSPSSDYSLESFLKNPKDGVLSDRTEKFVLKKKNNDIILINRTSGLEIKSKFTVDQQLELMKPSNVPMNQVKYSVQTLSTHETVRNILLSKEDLVINEIEIPKSFSDLGRNDELRYFMQNYHFDASVMSNIENFTTYLPEAREELYYDKEHREQLEIFVEDFLKANRENQQKFSDRWLYKAVLKIIDPKREDVNKDTIDLLSYQTSIPEEKIREIMNDIIKYKNKFGLENAMVHEVHNNIVCHGDHLGDVMLEFVTLKRLVDTNYNSYSHDTKYATNQFKNNILRSTHKHLSRKLIDNIPLDSYSVKQAESYKRKVKTDFVKNATESKLLDVKLKIHSDLLPQDAFVFVDLKAKLSKTEMKELTNDIAYLIKNKQINDSISTGQLKDFLDLNEEKILKVESRVMEKVSYIEYSRKEANIKKVSSQIFDILQGSMLIDDNFVKKAKPIIQDSIARDKLDNFVDILANVFEKMNIDVNRKEALKAIECQYVRSEEEKFKERKKMIVEKIINKEHGLFTGSDKIKRQDGLKWLLTYAQDLLVEPVKIKVEEAVDKKLTNVSTRKKLK